MPRSRPGVLEVTIPMHPTRVALDYGTHCIHNRLMELKFKYNLERLLAYSCRYTLDLTTSRVRRTAPEEEESDEAPEINISSNGNVSELTFRVLEPPAGKRSENVKRRRYEGGYSIWESTWFLLSFLQKAAKNDDNSLAIDLGCGNGICGVLALRKGYRVLFQDLNWEVLEDVVVPNVLLNHTESRKLLGKLTEIIIPKDEDIENVTDASPEEQTPEGTLHKSGLCNSIPDKEQGSDPEDQTKQGQSQIQIIIDKENGNNYKLATSQGKLCLVDPLGSLSHSKLEEQAAVQYELLSCLWEDMPALADGTLQKYRNCCDLVVASECIYRAENYPALANVLLCYLRTELGTAYIATKRIYFGMDGGSYEFIDYIKNRHQYGNYFLQAEIQETYQPSGSSNVIDIIRIRKLAFQEGGEK